MKTAQKKTVWLYSNARFVFPFLASVLSGAMAPVAWPAEQEKNHRANSKTMELSSIGRSVVALLILFSLGLLITSSASAAQARIVAVGDIHGDFDAFVSILQRARLIDGEHRWVGGNATLVQTGDFLDRGPKSREVLDLMMTLEKQAKKGGGRVLVLLGNHEMMNMTGDLGYVTPEDYASFADKHSGKRRKVAFKTYIELRKRRARAMGQPPPIFTPETERAWMESHPLGFVEHREAFGPKGKYGGWLRQRPAVARLRDVVFLHGGISPALSSWKVSDINKRLEQEVRTFDDIQRYLVKRQLILPFFTLEEVTAAVRAEHEARMAKMNLRAAEAAQTGKTFEPSTWEGEHLNFLKAFLNFPTWLSFHPKGPLWFRGFARWPETEGAPHVANLLENYGVAHFVVGHTMVRNGQIQPRFGGKVFLIDTGILRNHFPGGRPSALEIQDGKFTAIYLDQRTALLERKAISSHSIGAARSASP